MRAERRPGAAERHGQHSGRWDGLLKLPAAGSLALLATTLLWSCGSGGDTQDMVDTAGDRGQDPEAPCLLSLVPTGVVLEPDQQARVPDPARGVGMDSTGRFLTQTHTPGTLARWGPDGAFQGSVGRFGEGPEEFGIVSTVLAGPADTFHVFHESRWSMVTPSLEVIPVSRSPLVLPERAEGAAILRDGRLLVPGWEPGGPVAVLLNRAGEVEAEIGTLAVGTVPLLVPPGIVHLQGDTTFLVGPVAWTASGYVVERWSLNGQFLERWERPADWVRDVVGIGDPVPPVGRLSLHRRGIVHLSASAPNPSYRAAATGMQGSPRWPRFELLGASDGRLLAGGWYGFPGETSVEEMWGQIPASGLTYRIVTTAGGLEGMEILRKELRPRPGRGPGECLPWGTH